MKAVVVTTVLTAVLFLVLPTSCQKDNVGTMFISGVVIDRDSKQGIPNIRVAVDGVTQFGPGRRIESGKARTNTDGRFNVAVDRIENVAFYEFFANSGGSDFYTEASDYHGQIYLDSITENNIQMVYELSKLEPLRIRLRNLSPINDDDYVSLYFYSETMGFERVKSVENYGVGNLKYETSVSDDGTRTEWKGQNVNSVINGTILVNEALSIIVTIRKNGQLTEVVKSITGKRNSINEIDIYY